MIRVRVLMGFVVFLATACASESSSTITETTTHAGVVDHLTQVFPDLVAFRRDLHRHPELSGQEVRTSAKVADRLEALGFTVRRGIGGHGVVATLQGSQRGPVVAFRADMDAVRDTSPDPVEFASTVPGVRHICGHDIHVTIGIAIAEAVTKLGGDFPGTVMLIFQPAEENVQGARAMLADGAFTPQKPDAIFAFHTAPFETGQIVYSETTLIAARDRVTVQFNGDRNNPDTLRLFMLGLGNSEQFGMHPVGTDFVFADFRVPQPHGDGVWQINGYFSLATQAARSRVQAALEKEVTARNGTLDYQQRFAPGVDNDTALTRSAVSSMRAELGEAALQTLEAITPAFSEDFGAMLDESAGAMFYLGVSNQSQGWVGMPHSPGYVADEKAILVGARAMARVMIDFLEAK